MSEEKGDSYHQQPPPPPYGTFQGVANHPPPPAMGFPQPVPPPGVSGAPPPPHYYAHGYQAVPGICYLLISLYLSLRCWLFLCPFKKYGVFLCKFSRSMDCCDFCLDQKRCMDLIFCMIRDFVFEIFDIIVFGWGFLMFEWKNWSDFEPKYFR